MFNLSLVAKGLICLISFGTIGGVASLASVSNSLNNSEITKEVISDQSGQQSEDPAIPEGNIVKKPNDEEVENSGKENSIPSNPSDKKGGETIQSNSLLESSNIQKIRKPSFSFQITYNGPMVCLHKLLDGNLISVTCKSSQNFN
ncbi:hypothetical protein MSUIS_07140 [Mycoplasma suis KI3806]|uniref:Uncharacterized protein n=1 Tax=Mycoplasma suis (strain KI_3806) TaxID=708248 RepID=F0V2C6_MYCS3|nr:hypothetical protein [Mycoplasma suis]CBZ40807.1 hypothetical protein MSUIS_07140 [Mycoplasma suis KI3806]